MDWMIKEEHESRGLYYLNIGSYVSCVAISSPKLLHE